MIENNDEKPIERKHFFRSVGTLASGTAIAQLLLLLCLPIITRLYSPDEFGVFAIYTAWVSMLAIVASLRLEIALPLPETDVDAAGILIIAIISILTFSGFLAIAGSLFPAIYSQSLGTEKLGLLTWAVPTGVLVTSTYSVLQYWASRKRRYKITANVRVAQSAIETSAQIGSGFYALGGLGLIGGQIAGRLVAVFFLAISTYRDVAPARSLITRKRIKFLAHHYRRFPLLSTPDALINSSGLQAAIILIAVFVDAAAAGILFLAIRILQLPIGLLANAISQVYLTELPKHIREGNDSFLTAQVLKNLIDYAVGPILFIAITANIFLDFFLGEQWGMAGWIMTWMTPWMILLMLVSPISIILQAKDMSHVSLVVNCLGFAMRCVPIAILGWQGLGTYIPEVFAICSALFYLIRLFICMSFANVSAAEVFCRRKSIFIFLAWLTTSVVLRLIFS